MSEIKNKILIYENIPINFFEDRVNSQLLLESSAKKYGINTVVSTIKNSKRKRIDMFYKKNNIGNMRGLNISTTSKSALRLCRDKYKLEKYLNTFGINVLNSEIFSEDEKDKALNYIKKEDYNKFVIKPTSLYGGKGIETNISLENFSEAWDRCLKAQKNHNNDEPQFIIQKHIEGFDIRISIIEGLFAAAEIRFPPYIIGDGYSTIEQLIDKKNAIRGKIPYFKTKLIPVNQNVIETLKKYEMNLDDILKKNEVLILNKISNMVLGGESIDITKNVSEDIVKEAIKAVAAIPGLHSASVDFMCENYTVGKGYIIEVNTNGNHTQHHVPFKGEAQKPFELLVNCLLIKYKMRNGISLTKDEQEISKELFSFLELKDQYAIKLL